MKKFIVVAAGLALTIVALRRFGPTLGKRAMTRCQEMMARHQGRLGERPCVELQHEQPDIAKVPA